MVTRLFSCFIQTTMKQASTLLSTIVILLTMLILHTSNASAKLYMGKITMQVGETRTVEAVPPISAYTASGSFSKSGTGFWISANGSYTCRITATYVGTGTLSYWGSVARANTWTTDIYDLYWDVEVKPSSGGGSSTGSGVLVNQVGFYPSSLTMEVGDKKNVLVLIMPTNATNQKVEWSSDNPVVASVSSDSPDSDWAVVEAKSMGTANIICKTTDGSGKQAICPVEVMAKNGEFKKKNANGIELLYHITSEKDKTCAVGGKWGGRAVDQETAGALIIPSIVEGYNVTAIGETAFYGCSSIISVSIPSSVTKIRRAAFKDCTSMTQLSGLSTMEYIEESAFVNTPWFDALPDGPIYIGKTLYGYKGIIPDNTTIKVKDGTTCITRYALYKHERYGWSSNPGLVALEIPASVNMIGHDDEYWDDDKGYYEYPTFYSTPNLQSIIVDKNNPYYSSPENSNAIVEKSTGILIAACNNTEIPSSVRAISNHAFDNLRIKSLNIPDNVIFFGGVFYCPNLEIITFGRNVRKIISSYNNPKLNRIVVNPDNPYYDSRDDCNAVIEKSTSKLIIGCASTIIPEEVEEISNSAFNGNGSENSINSIIIPNKVKKISNGAFGWLRSLESIVIGKSVKEIESFAFSNSSKLTSVYSLNDIPSEIDKNAFENNTYEKGTLYVPTGSKNNYMETTGWSKFKNIVEFDPTTEPWASVKGDVNGDNQVNGTDLVALTNIILGKNAQTTAADVNGDGYVNGTDYVALANIVLGRSNAKASAMAKGAVQAVATTGLTIEPLDIKAGETKEMVIDLTNPNDEITLVQFDLRLPAGLSVKQTGGEYDIDIAGRTTWRKHSLDANATNGIIRFLLASSSNATLTGTEGAVIKITITADNSFTGGDIQLENILMVTPAEKEIKQDVYTYHVGQSQPSPASTGLAIEPFSISAGSEMEMVIDMTNPDDEITLVQFDLRLPAGLSVKQTGGEYDIDIAGRTTWRKHSLDANATNGIVRFLLASSSNATLTGTEGAVIKMTLKADNTFAGGAVKLENILLVTPAEKEIKQPNVNYTIGATGIKGVVADDIKKDATIYNLSGQRLDKPRKGINIIGGKKVMVK